MNIIKKYIDNKDIPYLFAAILLGFLNHFLYEWSGKAPFVALFCPVNESVWEHLKLLFFPLLFVSAAEYLRYRPQAADFFYRRFIAAVCAMVMTVALFYTYTGILGRGFLAADIFIFLISMFFAFYIDARLFREKNGGVSLSAVFLLWLFTSLCFFAFTCFPPNLPVFFSN